MRKWFKIALLFGASLLWLGSSQATDYPKQKITIIVPYAPGAASDITARLIGEALSRDLKTTVVIENKPGAGSVIGAEFAKGAKPDGYTLLMGGLSSIATNPTTYRALPYDPKTDFMPLALVGDVPFVIVVHPDFHKTLSELIAYGKAHPGKLLMASAGNGSPHHLFGELLASMASIKVTHVPYRGGQPAVGDLMGRHTQMMVADLPVARAAIASGKLRALAVTSKKRLPDLPSVPTVEEEGLSGYEATSWLMLLAPIKTSQPVIDKLHVTIKSALAEPELRKKIAEMMTPSDSPSPAALQEFIRVEIERWAKVVKMAGLAGSQ